MGQRHEHRPGPAAILSDVNFDDGVSAAEPVLVPGPLEDALGHVALLPRKPQVVFQNPVYCSGVGFHLNLSKVWACGAGFVAGSSPAARSRPASCAPCPGAGRTLAMPPGCSSPPGEPADTCPLCTSIAPSIGSAITLWMAAGGPVCNRQMSAATRPHGTIYLRCLHSYVR